LRGGAHSSLTELSICQPLTQPACCSENQLGIQHKARGWDDAAAKRLQRRSADLDESDDSDDGEEYDEALLLQEMEAAEGAGHDQQRWSRVDGNRELLDQQLARALEEYDDLHIGALSDASDDEDMDGDIDLDENDEAFNAAMDEFLQDAKDRVYAEGSLVRKGARSLLLVKQGEAIAPVDNNNYDADVSDVNIQQEVREQEALQQAWREDVLLLEAARDRQAELEDLMGSQEYLREVKPHENWDCETILSTYSTLDNHPTVIRKAKSVSTTSNASNMSTMRPGKHMNKAQYQEYREYLAENGGTSIKKPVAAAVGAGEARSAQLPCALLRRKRGGRERRRRRRAESATAKRKMKMEK
jgi:protein LTV1